MSYSDKVREIIPSLNAINLAIAEYNATNPADFIHPRFFKSVNTSFSEGFKAQLAKLILLSEKKEENDANKEKVFKYIKALTDDINLFLSAPHVSETNKTKCQDVLIKCANIEKDIAAPTIEKKAEPRA